MSDNVRTLWRGGGPAIPILKSVIGTAGNPKTTLVLFFVCLPACKTTNEYISIIVIQSAHRQCLSVTLATFMKFALLFVTAPFLATALQRQYDVIIIVYGVYHMFLPPKTSTLEAS